MLAKEFAKYASDKRIIKSEEEFKKEIIASESPPKLIKFDHWRSAFKFPNGKIFVIYFLGSYHKSHIYYERFGVNTLKNLLKYKIISQEEHDEFKRTKEIPLTLK